MQPDLSRITAGLGDVVCDEVFTQQLGSHTGRVFEECAKQYMWRVLKEKKLPVSFKKIGRWWGNNPKERCEEEIDFIAISGEKAIFGECKWKNTFIGEDILDNLIRRSSLFPEFKSINYMLFSKSGFSDILKQIIKKRDDTTLIGIDDTFFDID